jgi:hypothetical protein
VFLDWFIPVEETGTAECHCAGVAENFPLPLRRLYCERRTNALDTLTLNQAAINKVKGQSQELNDSGHPFSPGLARRRCLATGTEPQGPHHVFAGDDTRKPLIAIDHRHAADPVIDHQLEHPRQPGIRSDIDEFRGQDVGDCAFHQIIIARHHVGRSKDETRKVVELRNHPYDLPVFLDRVGVEILSFKEVAEFAQRLAAGYRLDVARHVVCDHLFYEAFQDVILNRNWDYSSRLSASDVD